MEDRSNSAALPYTSVKVMMISWKDSAEDEFKSQLRELSIEFKNYRFDVEEFEIPGVRPHQTLSERLQLFLRHDKEGSLLIVYYGGHGASNQDKNNMWLW